MKYTLKTWLKIVGISFPMLVATACEQDEFHAPANVRGGGMTDTVTMKYGDNMAVELENNINGIIDRHDETRKIMVKVDSETKHKSAEFTERDWGHIRNTLCKLNSKCAENGIDICGADTLFVNPNGGASLPMAHYHADLDKQGMQQQDSSALAGLLRFKVMRDTTFNELYAKIKREYGNQ